MTELEKCMLEKDAPTSIIHPGSWLQRMLSMIKVILIAVLGLILILFVRAFASLYRGAEAPEIDLRDIER